MHGTGTLPGFETDFIDRYIKDGREGVDYEIMSDSLWNFCKAKYGCDYEVKRFY